MGQQHNSHIANDTAKVVKVVLTDNDKRNISQIIEPRNYVCIPTPHGRVTVSAFRKIDDKFNPKAEATYTDNSDRSFIIKEVQGSLNIVRSKYGKIWEEDSGLR